MPLLALKVDVDTLRGTREGVPRLMRLFRMMQARATFLFSVGPDHTGRALRRVFRPGFLSKVSRTSVLEHYGWKTLMYGTLLPGPHIGRTCAALMRSARDDGFEVGLHTYDHVKWQDFVARRDRDWTAREIERGVEAFSEALGAAPRVHGAAGWQMNDAAFEIEAQAGFDYASDTRGTHPFVPVVGGAAVECPQVPTTLPTLDELIGVDGMSAHGAASSLLHRTTKAPSAGHVYTLHAELEGMRLLGVLTTLLLGWRAQGYQLVSTRELLESLADRPLPRHEVVAAPISGRSGLVMTQGTPA